MNENISEEKNEIGERLPWCPTCSSHTDTTQRDDKDVCAVCYEDGVFTPVNTKLAYIWLGLAAIFFFLGAASWGPTSFFISVVLGSFAASKYLKYRKWSGWAAGERREERSRRRSKKKKRRKQKSENKAAPRNKEKPRKSESPPPAEPPDDIRKDRAPLEAPVPKPPPPPPDFDD